MQEVKDPAHASRSDAEESRLHPKLWLAIVVVLNVAIALGLAYLMFKDVTV